MTTQQIIRVLIFSLIFVVPVVIRLVKVAQDAKEKRRLEQFRQYQINEAMRTGRPVEPVMMAPSPQAMVPVPFKAQQSAQDRLREMAARRQAQIEALRRQKSGSSNTPASMSKPPTRYQQTVGESAPTAFQQKPGVATGYQQQAPVATGYQQQAPVVTGYQPTPQPARQPARQQPKQRQQKKPQTRDPRRQPPQQAASAPPAQEFPAPTGEIGGPYHEHDGDITHRLLPDGPSMTPVARPSSGDRGSVKVNLADLRQAIVLREILGKPMALREAAEG